MARGALRPGAQELTHHQVRRPFGNLQQAVLACSLVVRDAGLDQVPVAVKLVLDLQVGPTHLGKM